MRPGLRWRLADLGRAFKDALFASPEGAQPMEPLRGTARRVIVVPSPDPRVFEQAVFIVSDDYLHTPGRARQSFCAVRGRRRGSTHRSICRRDGRGRSSSQC